MNDTFFYIINLICINLYLKDTNTKLLQRFEEVWFCKDNLTPERDYPCKRNGLFSVKYITMKKPICCSFINHWSCEEGQFSNH